MATWAEKWRTMMSRHSVVDPVAHGGSRLGRRPVTLANEDVEAQGFQMHSSVLTVLKYQI